jgi:Mrp family chromosome partitioning ATPase
LFVDDVVQRHYKSLWAGLQAQARSDEVDVALLGVTSPRRGDGASTVAVQLAVAAARSNVGSVLLVDADLTRPSLQRVFKLPAQPGFSDVLRRTSANRKSVIHKAAREKSNGQKMVATHNGALHDGAHPNGNHSGLAKAQLYPTPLLNLHVLTAGALNGERSLVEYNASLADSVREVSAGFDLVIFDMPPVDEISFALRLAGLMDAVLLVIESDRTPPSSAKRTTELLHRAGARLLGVVLNNQPAHMSAGPRSEF